MNRLTLLLLVLSFKAFGQKLENCATCKHQALTEDDIKGNELFEIELLRNEIFARHGYNFKNQRLNEYFSQFSWFKDNSGQTFNSDELNKFENHNIQLFRKVEEKIKAERQAILNRVKLLQKALVSNDSEAVRELILEAPNAKGGINWLRSVLPIFDLDDIHWFKQKAHYSIVTDNGKSSSITKIEFENNRVTVTKAAPSNHSSVMNSEEAFKYPSDYYSEDEHGVNVIMTFEEGQLKLISFFSAG
jgi:hypothetical protein